MQRLLQGDVGSGKTVVALYALLRAVEAGRQGALMAPTETLAEQHFLTLEPLCAALGVRCVLLTGLGGLGEGARRDRGGRRADRGRDACADPARRSSSRTSPWRSCDEQHRFGVEQRQALVEGRSPHVLHMTATPIPRTLALTDLRRPRRERDREAAGEPQADRDGVGGRGALERGVRAPARASRRRPPGLRRLPADRAVGGAAGPRGRGGGRPAAARRARRATASACCTGGSGPPSGAR